MKKVIFTLLFLALFGGLFSQTYSPIAVTGFNLDAVAETFPNSLATTTQALDQVVAGGNSVMYSVGFATSAGWTGGLPNSGAISSGLKSYQLMPYTGNNALFAPSASSNTLTLTTPAQYSAVNFLVFSTEGSSTINVVLNYTDLTTTNAGNFTVQDWFGGPAAIISGLGRCKRVTSGATNDGLPTNPRFYGIDVSIPCTGQQKTLASITINGVSSNPAGGGGYVMAVSGVSYTPISASVAYSANLYCQLGASTTPTITGTAGGSFTSAPAGLSINASTGAINFPASTVNTYSVTYTTPGTCTVSATYTLSVVSNPTLAVNTATICPGATATLAAVPSISGGTYSWTPTSLTTQSISVSPLATTNYTVLYSISGCSVAATTTVVIDNSLTMTVNSATICSGDNAVLTANPSVAGGTFLWTPTGQTTQNNTVSPTATSSYTVLYTVNNCTAVAVANVDVKTTPTVSINSTAICSGQTATLTSNALPAGGNYTWSPGGGTGSSMNASPAATSGYSLSYELNGCTASANGQITVNANPVVHLSSSANNTAPLETIALTASGGSSYQWSTGQTGALISVSPAQTTVYCATVTTATGCKASDCMEITVSGESTLYLPNVFTPNGDGVNDIFYTPSSNLLTYDLKIYNRWGELLFQSGDPLKGWDGSFDGKKVSGGVYVYILKAKGADEVHYNKSGHITLLQ